MEPHDGKVEVLALVARQNGNDLYRATHYRFALLEYNKALCLSKPGSVEMAYAFANRSACYEECAMYDLALENIELALRNNYPDRSKLEKRATKCKTLMSSPDRYIHFDHGEFFKLSHPPHPKIPFIIEHLKLVRTPKRGRGVATTISLSVGDIVAIEKPLFYITKTKENYERCNNCLRNMRLNLIPCPSCPKAMFCSEECRLSDTSHQIACRNKGIDETLNCILRLKQRALKIAGSNQKLIEIMKKHRSRKTVFDYDLSDSNDLEYSRTLLLTVSMLAKTMTAAGKSLDGYSRSQLLQGTPTSSEEEEEDLLKTIRKLFIIYSTNAYAISDNDITTNFPHEKEVGAGLLPFLSLMNHSCFPNAAMITVDNKCVLFVVRPIKAGEELFVSYGPLSRIWSKSVRAKELKFKQINCECIACTSDYNTLSNLEVPRVENCIPDMKVFSTKAAIEQYRNNCFYIENNYSEPPKFEIEFLIKHNEHLLHAIANHVYKPNGLEKNVFCDLLYNFKENGAITTGDKALVAKDLKKLKNVHPLNQPSPYFPDLIQRVAATTIASLQNLPF